MKGPSYFSSDLSLMKNFKIGEGKSIQFRVHGTNFLNHPNPQFSLNGAQDINLQLKIPSTGAYAGTNQNPATTGSRSSRPACGSLNLQPSSTSEAQPKGTW